MDRKRTVVVTALLVGVLGSPAGAASRSDPRAFCAALARDLRAVPPWPELPTPRAAKQARDALHRAARVAPADVARTTRLLAGWYGALARGDRRDLSPTGHGLRYALASGTLSIYVRRHCTSVAARSRAPAT